MARIIDEEISMDELEALCEPKKVSEMKLFKVYLVCGNKEYHKQLTEKYPFLEWKEVEKTSKINGKPYITNVCDMRLNWKQFKKLIKDNVVDTSALDYTSCMLKR